MRIYAVDEGFSKSGWCVVSRDTLRPLAFGKTDNGVLGKAMADPGDLRAEIEKVKVW